MKPKQINAGKHDGNVIERSRAVKVTACTIYIVKSPELPNMAANCIIQIIQFAPY